MTLRPPYLGVRIGMEGTTGDPMRGPVYTSHCGEIVPRRPLRLRSRVPGLGGRRERGGDTPLREGVLVVGRRGPRDLPVPVPRLPSVSRPSPADRTTVLESRETGRRERGASIRHQDDGQGVGVRRRHASVPPPAVGRMGPLRRARCIPPVPAPGLWTRGVWRDPGPRRSRRHESGRKKDVRDTGCTPVRTVRS